ncbi:Putative aminotransferase/MSMEI_6121 [BD1-7 clade bacterium]|uniref:Aminotransferase/MSMEI_6121 n=1 Tax=BD1-7 clade bacterium TaxID=2029982 RepID=A0A5S9P4T2_9GAMM|nr:Putative aminotransferase/MSMEI_6121 [BD1-7 clade bacterium]CAA0098255.1 Putative aminotransferase/MSMEI_6121 [BD1-7 clade bacterium]
MNAFNPDQFDQNALQQLQRQLRSEFETLKSAGLSLDLTRGKPSADQLSLSDSLDGILAGNYKSDSGTDTRNYGGLDGLPEAKALAAQALGVDVSDVLIGGNSSLTLMYQSILFAHMFGLNGEVSAWKNETKAKFLCPVPGYDRHFSICEDFDIEMISVPMDDNGPIMDEVEKLIANDTSIKGIWCVPRFSNPTGISYSDEVVDRIARLGNIASDNFRVFWDNAYAIHHINKDAAPIKCLLQAARDAGCEDSVLMFGSTSKVTFAGAGLAYMAASAKNLAAFKNHLGIASIGPDKVNQLRHVKFFGDFDGLLAHMDKHAALLKPRFDAVLSALNTHFGDSDALTWTTPEGGYFVSVDTQQGLASSVVAMAAELGVKLTPAGATFPYGNDPENRNIRLAPSFPTVDDITKAMEIFVLCVKLATVNAKLAD